MEMTGEFRIPAPRQRVWEGLNDPETLKQCIPGCESIDKVSDTEFTAKVVAKIGPVKASFGGKVTLTDLDPPQAYTISGEGAGGVAGFAKGSARVRLDEDSGATLMHYDVTAHVGGKLAQIGSRLIDGTSRKMAGDFFDKFAGLMAPEAAGGATVGAPAEPNTEARVTIEPAPLSAAVEAQPSAADAGELRLSPAVWVTGLTAIVAAMLYFFTRR